jgi:hypothetical protein
MTTVSAKTWYRRNARALGAMRLSTVMSGSFDLLSIPVLIFILVYNCRQNAAAINATLNDVVAKTKLASIEDAKNLIDPVAGTLTLLAAVAAEDPEAFRKEESRHLCSTGRLPRRHRSMRPMSASRTVTIVS